MVKFHGLYGMALEIGKKTCDVIEEPSVLNILPITKFMKKNRLLCIFLPEMSWSVKAFDEAKYLSFFYQE